MNNNGLKIIRIVFGTILLCGMIFLLFNIVNFFRLGKIESVEVFTEPNKLYGNEKCYIMNDMIYTINTESGVMHIFEKDGEFKQGFQFPTNGGTIWVGMKDRLYVYCIRKQLEFEVSSAEIVNQSNVYYNNPKEFYNSHTFTDVGLLSLEKNRILLSDENKEVFLEAESSVLSISFCFVLFAICFLTFLFATGLHSKFWRKRQ